jgi:hypothetical protein
MKSVCVVAVCTVYVDATVVLARYTREEPNLTKKVTFRTELASKLNMDRHNSDKTISYMQQQHKCHKM